MGIWISFWVVKGDYFKVDEVVYEFGDRYWFCFDGSVGGGGGWVILMVKYFRSR